VIPAPRTESELIADVQAHNVRLVRFLYCDPSGVIRGKSVHGARLEGKVLEGVGLTRAQNAVNLFEDLVPIEGMEPVGELRVVPDVATYTRLPWLDGRIASVLCDQVGHDGQDWGGCTRAFLKRAINQAAARDVQVFAAFENEFYLARAGPTGPTAWADGAVYSSAGLDRSASVMHDITDALVEQGLIVEQVLNEYGRGQQEISVRYTDALAAADQQLKFRDTVRGVAEVRHGLLASFAPKPFADQVGSGAHLHFSIWDATGITNLMGDPANPFEISSVGRAFLAGVLQHLPALVALTCPSYLSYERLQPHAWAGSTVSWGYDNREAALRVASPFKGREAESANAELKTCDGSSNPYLALGGLILCGLDGIRRGLELPEPARVDPAKLVGAQALACGVQPLPSDQSAALDELERDEVLCDGLGDFLLRSIIGVRRAEFAKASEAGLDWVRSATFSVY
jgi:glutamine synthetase